MLNPTQYMRFLGGEVSPNLWNMADFEKYGKWFANAENIRFETLGAFRNRFGFAKVANTKNNITGEKIKLLSFVFNNNESFMIELGKYYFRVFKEGKPILDEDGNPKVWNTNISFEEDEDVKYVQSGDTVFLATGTNPLYEIHRLEVDGSEWEIKEFKFLDDCPPTGEQNTDKEKTITSIKQTQENTISYPLNFNSYGNGFFQDVIVTTFDYNGNGKTVFENHTNFFATLDDVVSAINNDDSIGSLKNTTGIEIEKSSTSDTFICKKQKNDGKETPEYLEISIGDYSSETSYFIAPNSNNYIKRLLLELSNQKEYTKAISLPSAITDEFNIQRIDLSFTEISTNTLTGCLNLLKSKLETATTKSTTGSTVPTPHWTLNYEINGDYLSMWFSKKNIENEWEIAQYDFGSLIAVYSFNIFKIANKIESNQNTYSFSFTDDVALKDKEIGDVVMVENYMEAGTSSVKALGPTGGAWRYGDIMKTDGAWSLVSTGNWTGTLILEYSLTGEDPWKPVVTIESGSTSGGGNNDIIVSNNANHSGTVTAGESKIVYMRVKAKVDSAGTYKLTANATGRTFTINSYYKIINKTDNKNCIVECVKNDIGEFKDSFTYSFGVFNSKDGYPAAIGFYQNRLILGKGYELWLSKSNDFWNFYEPIAISKDDPINMSLLSYKVNTIKNIVSLRNFFVFSTGAEYGITSEGALSQDDKYLSTLSMHGSISARPIIVGNIVLFVDSSSNTVRALKYTFESESYEAEEISIFQEQIFKNKKFVTTEYLPNEKECLFLDTEGTVWVLKFMPEQEMLAWSHWKHAKHKITNLCAVQNGAKHDLYIAVDTENGKQIELMTDNRYLDSVETYSFDEATDTINTDFTEDDEVAVFADGSLYNVKVGENGVINLPNEAQNVTIGLKYTSEATLLSPVLQIGEGVYTTYNRHKPFKAYFCYRDSYGFKVGAKEEEKMKVDLDFNNREKELSSGKTNILFTSRYDGSSQVSFVQEEPYQMNIENILLEVDYGGR